LPQPARRDEEQQRRHGRNPGERNQAATHAYLRRGRRKNIPDRRPRVSQSALRWYPRRARFLRRPCRRHNSSGATCSLDRHRVRRDGRGDLPAPRPSTADGAAAHLVAVKRVAGRHLVEDDEFLQMIVDRGQDLGACCTTRTSPSSTSSRTPATSTFLAMEYVDGKEPCARLGWSGCARAGPAGCRSSTRRGRRWRSPHALQRGARAGADGPRPVPAHRAPRRVAVERAGAATAARRSKLCDFPASPRATLTRNPDQDRASSRAR